MIYYYIYCLGRKLFQIIDIEYSCFIFFFLKLYLEKEIVLLGVKRFNNCLGLCFEIFIFIDYCYKQSFFVYDLIFIIIKLLLEKFNDKGFYMFLINL